MLQIRFSLMRLFYSSGFSAAIEAGVRGGGERRELLCGWEAAALCGQSSTETVQGEFYQHLMFCKFGFDLLHEGKKR